MKNKFVIALALIGIIGLFAFQKGKQSLNDVFEVLGIEKDLGVAAMQDNLLSASLNVPFSKKDYSKISPSQRAAIVRELGNYMKQYFKSAEMAKAYKKYRDDRMPGRQEGINVNERIAEIKQSIRQTEEERKKASADTWKMYDSAIEVLRKELDVLQNPEHPDYKIYSGVVDFTPEQQEEINRQIKLFSKEYPADVQQYLKLKLRQFLENTADIDFSAKLIQRNGKFEFENREYESRDHNWKKCFRAGKETIEAARAFAIQWLAEIK